MPAATLAVPRNTGTTQITHQPILDGVELPPRPGRDDRAGHYQRVLLNVRTGELSFFCADWRVHVPVPDQGEDRTLWNSQYPGSTPNTTVGTATEPVPKLLSFFIDTWTPTDWPADEEPPTPAWVYMTREQGEAFVASLVPLAQRLVDNLFRVPGTDDLEWSAESVAAERAIEAACRRDQQGPRSDGESMAGRVNFADAVTAVPDLIKPAWAEMHNAALNDEADTLNRFAGRWHPQLKETFGQPYRDGSGLELDLYGARSWLYAYRAHEADHRPVLDAASWFADPEHTLNRRVTADHDNAALAAFADRERTAAAKEGIKLVGIERIIREYRDELRAAVLDDLARAHEAVEQLQRAKAARAGLLGQIIGWGDPRHHSDNDAELGRRSGMTRQAVNQLRKTLTGTDDEGSD